MILHSEEIDGYLLEVVDGKDIARTYCKRGVHSCMVGSTRPRFYEFVEGLRMMRIIRPKKEWWSDNYVVMRALIWKAYYPNGTSTNFLDRVYTSGLPNITTIFNKHWKRFADKRTSSLILRAKVNPKHGKTLIRSFPYMDTFCYADEGVTELATKYRPKYTKILQYY